MELTGQQEAAVIAQGNVLVMASAGTGKTRTLVERAVRLLADPASDLSLDRVLMVTFTEAAATEMRRRIREELERRLDAAPNNERLHKQLTLLDTAAISTLHSFCLNLVRQHFYELGLDPQLTVLTEEQTRLAASEALEQMFKIHYKAKPSERVRGLIQELHDGWDKPVREAILGLHEFTQSRPDPAGWHREQKEYFAEPNAIRWQQWFREGLQAWRDRWAAALEQESDEAGRTLLDELKNLKITEEAAWRAAIGEALDQLKRIQPEGKKPPLLEKFFLEMEFWRSLCPGQGQADPLEEDWQRARGHMLTFLELSMEFACRFGEAKREAGTLDFHDLEQYALRLLWDSDAQQPTPLARQWQERLQWVFIDEYQDINAAQDLILRALSREGIQANRFMVGDVKQSIYRFRQADPGIFQKYAATWTNHGAPGQTLFLSENFRGHESILKFVNALFDKLMWPELGGVRYDEQAHLRFGQAENRGALADTGEPRVHIHLRLTGRDATEEGEWKESDGGEGEELEPSALSAADLEARLVAGELRGLRDQGYAVWDPVQNRQRPVQWQDMVILMRAPGPKVESYAKEFARAGIPLQAKRTGFYETLEVQDLLNLLMLLDNPLQDLPTLAVLRSPMVGLVADELATIRLAQPKATFWAALQIWRRSQSQGGPHSITLQKVDRFLNNYERWRTLSRHASLAHRLEAILIETQYLDWLLSQPRAEQRQANVQQLLALARKFDEGHRQGLYGFLDFVEAQKSSAGDKEPAPLETRDVVRLMSVHQSKGLEFPIVVAPDLAKRFNLRSSKGGILLDERYGLCPLVRPAQSRQKYPSLPRWLAQQRQRSETLGEELRLLYVACTRARDLLLLIGTCAKSTVDRWHKESLTQTHRLYYASSVLQWLGPWLVQNGASVAEHQSGRAALFSWHRHGEGAPSDPALNPPINLAPALVPDPEALAALEDRLLWSYPFNPATREPAKTSVTALRHRVAQDTDSEAKPLLESFSFTRQRGQLTAAASGTAHHSFMQHAGLDKVSSLASLEGEKKRQVAARLLTAEEGAALDLGALLAFWQSHVGAQILAKRSFLQRELPITIRLGGQDLAQLPGFAQMPENDFIVAQGVIDLAVLLPDEIWLLDFKTDRVRPGDLEEKRQLYLPQIRLYAHAVQRIYQRPVTHAWLHFFALGRTVEETPSKGDAQLTLF